MQDLKSLMLCWRSLSGCGRACVYIRFDHWGGQYIENGLWRTEVNVLRLTVTYLHATINMKLQMQNRKLEPTGLAKPSETPRLMGTGPGLNCEESADWGFGWLWNQTDTFFRSKPGPLAGYPDPFLTLLTINNITQYWCMKGYYPMGFYHLPAGITLSYHGLATVGAPEWPSTSCQLMIYS